MSNFAKLQPAFIVLAAVAGIVIGRFVTGVEEHAGGFIEPFLIIMLFFVFLPVDINEISKSFANLRFSISSLLINFVWTPVFAFILARIFFAEQMDLQIGFIMLMVTPCTDWYLVFTRLAGGNVPLGSSILPMNLILQILLLPMYLWVFMGESASIDFETIALGLLFVLALPLAAANVLKRFFVKIRRTGALEKIAGKSDDIQFILLCLAIISMFASQGAVLLSNLYIFSLLLPALLLFFAEALLLAVITGRRLGLPFPDIVSLVFTTSARNSPISLAIAVITFPRQPLISLVLVMGPLIELPVLAFDSWLIKKALIKSSP